MTMLNEGNENDMNTRTFGVSTSTFWCVALTGASLSLGFVMPLLPTISVVSLLRVASRCCQLDPLIDAASLLAVLSAPGSKALRAGSQDSKRATKELL